MPMTGQDPRRLADYVISRRTALGYDTQEELAAAAGVSAKTIGRLERGERVSSATRGKIERALAWVPGSMRAVLAGREPTATAEPGPAFVDPAAAILDELHIVDTESYGLDMADRLLEARIRVLNSIRVRPKSRTSDRPEN